VKQSLRLAVVEGQLEVPAVRKLLQSLAMDPGDGFEIINKYGRDKFWEDIPKYNKAAARLGPIFALADLEQLACAAELCSRHVPHRHPNLLLRIAVRMLESWILADSRHLANFLGVSPALLPTQPDLDPHPKLTLVNLARRSTKHRIRADLVPEPGGAGVVGKLYTPRMTEFLDKHWDPIAAQENSDSLRRTIHSLRKCCGS